MTSAFNLMEIFNFHVAISFRTKLKKKKKNYITKEFHVFLHTLSMICPHWSIQTCGCFSLLGYLVYSLVFNKLLINTVN